MRTMTLFIAIGLLGSVSPAWGVTPLQRGNPEQCKMRYGLDPRIPPVRIGLTWTTLPLSWQGAMPSLMAQLLDANQLNFTWDEVMCGKTPPQQGNLPEFNLRTAELLQLARVVLNSWIVGYSKRSVQFRMQPDAATAVRRVQSGELDFALMYGDEYHRASGPMLREVSSVVLSPFEAGGVAPLYGVHRNLVKAALGEDYARIPRQPLPGTAIPIRRLSKERMKRVLDLAACGTVGLSGKEAQNRVPLLYLNHLVEKIGGGSLVGGSPFFSGVFQRQSNEKTLLDLLRTNTVIHSAAFHPAHLNHFVAYAPSLYETVDFLALDSFLNVRPVALYGSASARAFPGPPDFSGIDPNHHARTAALMWDFGFHDFVPGRFVEEPVPDDFSLVPPAPKSIRGSGKVCTAPLVIRNDGEGSGTLSYTIVDKKGTRHGDCRLEAGGACSIDVAPDVSLITKDVASETVRVDVKGNFEAPSSVAREDGVTICQGFPCTLPRRRGNPLTERAITVTLRQSATPTPVPTIAVTATATPTETPTPTPTACEPETLPQPQVQVSCAFGNTVSWNNPELTVSVNRQVLLKTTSKFLTGFVTENLVGMDSFLDMDVTGTAGSIFSYQLVGESCGKRVWSEYSEVMTMPTPPRPRRLRLEYPEVPFCERQRLVWEGPIDLPENEMDFTSYVVQAGLDDATETYSVRHDREHVEQSIEIPFSVRLPNVRTAQLCGTSLPEIADFDFPQTPGRPMPEAIFSRGALRAFWPKIAGATSYKVELEATDLRGAPLYHLTTDRVTKPEFEYPVDLTQITHESYVVYYLTVTAQNCTNIAGDPQERSRSQRLELPIPVLVPDF